QFPSWLEKAGSNIDYAIQLTLAGRGPFYYLPDIMAVYRQRQGSLAFEMNRNKIDLYERLIFILESSKELYDSRHHRIINKKIAQLSSQRKDEKLLLDYPFVKYLRYKTYTRMIKDAFGLQSKPK